MQPMRSPFAEADRIRAAKEAKRVECVERLAKVLSKEFDFNELVFIWTFDFNAVLVEAFEQARLRTKK